MISKLSSWRYEWSRVSSIHSIYSLRADDDCSDADKDRSGWNGNPDYHTNVQRDAISIPHQDDQRRDEPERRAAEDDESYEPVPENGLMENLPVVGE